jgi:hypothetical protein
MPRLAVATHAAILEVAQVSKVMGIVVGLALFLATLELDRTIDDVSGL